VAGRLNRRRSASQSPGHGWRSVFLGFLVIGSTAFGGGSATIVAMRQLCVKRGWLTEAEFLDTVVLSRLTPGITILAQVLLIGRKACGVRGMVAAVVGLLLPAITITVAIARLYDAVSSSPVAAEPLLCVAAVAAGFAVALALQLLRDTFARSHFLLGPIVFVGYVAAAVLVGNPVLVLLIAIVAGILLPRLFETGTSDAES
jgi:chromate transporter